MLVLGLDIDGLCIRQQEISTGDLMVPAPMSAHCSERTTCATIVGMSVLPPDDPVLRRDKAALEDLYGDKIDRVILFGSRARGDAHAGSDYDIVVFLKSMSDRWAELNRMADLRIDFLLGYDAFFDTKPYAATAYQERTPLMREIRREGVAL
jgi:hypothetical protein